MLFGRFFGRFGRKKSVFFLALLQCSDGQSVAEWARIAYLRTDFLAWISFVNKLTFCALCTKWRMKNEEWRIRITFFGLKPPSCPPLGDDRLRSSACGLSGVSQANKTNSHSSFFILHSSFWRFFILVRARLSSRKSYLFVGRWACACQFCTLFLPIA